MTPTQAGRDLLVLISRLQKSAHAPIDDRYMEAVSAIASFRLAAEAAAFEKAAGVVRANSFASRDTIATAIRKLAGEKHD